jgi:hypothetical protein
MINSKSVGCGQRIVWVAPQAIRATSHHVGRVAVISEDGHARLPHHRTKCAGKSVGREWFGALGNAYMAGKTPTFRTIPVL